MIAPEPATAVKIEFRGLPCLALTFQCIRLQRRRCIAHLISGAGDKRKITRAGGVTWEGLQDEYDRLKLVRGLSNEAGRNNCFLNVIIQSLWHLRSFREALLAMQPQVGTSYLHRIRVQLMPISLRRLRVPEPFKLVIL